MYSMLSTPSRSGMASRGAAVPYTAAASARTWGAGVGEGGGGGRSRDEQAAACGTAWAAAWHSKGAWVCKAAEGHQATSGAGLGDGLWPHTDH